MPVEFSADPAVEELAEVARRIAAEVLAPRARDAERAGRWDDAALDAFASLGMRGLMLPRRLGGEPAAAAVLAVLEALAGGDAGGLLAADQPGPASAALAMLSRAGGGAASAAFDLATGCLSGDCRVALAVSGRAPALGTIAGGAGDAVFTLPWCPGWEPPRALVIATPASVVLYDAGGGGLSERELLADPVLGARRGGEGVPEQAGGAQPGASVVSRAKTSVLEAGEAPAGAFGASGGVSVTVSGSPLLAVHDARMAFFARAGARLWAAGVLIGIGRAALDYAIGYGRERIVFGRPVLAHQANAFEVAAAHGALEAARTAARAATWTFDQVLEASDPAGEAPADAVDREVPTIPHAAWAATIAHLEACDAAITATDLAVQLLGGHGYMEDHPCEKWWREVRALVLLFGGRDEAMEDLADHVLSLPDALVAL